MTHSEEQQSGEEVSSDPFRFDEWKDEMTRMFGDPRNDDDEIEGKKRRILVFTGRETGWKRARYKGNKNWEFSPTVAYDGFEIKNL
ncbi:hypothetical protein E3N88_09278 [Mikania micrantha]|uniref:Uncharacterized protein n=1 Tax=Mikania micrantha TaxID=192012 RepID=A0A5N6PJB1_9ASTR|nr:hypothetical protein E3N88_09278 [Mikania micrantha]